MAGVFMTIPVLALMVSMVATGVHTFSPHPVTFHGCSRMPSRSFQIRSTKLPDIQEMSPTEMRSELESYGISTRSFLEKAELQDAVEKARAEGKTPRESGGKNERKSSKSDKTSGSSRKERLKAEMEKAQAMKVGDLKKELQSRGISTKSFFEKSEFVRAYAEAVVDGTKKRRAAGAGTDDEEYDPSYRDVVMQKMNGRDPRMLRGTIIDVTLK